MFFFLIFSKYSKERKSEVYFIFLPQSEKQPDLQRVCQQKQWIFSLPWMFVLWIRLRRKKNIENINTLIPKMQYLREWILLI